MSFWSKYWTAKTRLWLALAMLVLMSLGNHTACCLNSEDEGFDPLRVRYCISVDPSSMSLELGGSQSFTVEPASGYKCDSITAAELPWIIVGKVGDINGLESITLDNPNALKATGRVQAKSLADYARLLGDSKTPGFSFYGGYGQGIQVLLSHPAEDSTYKRPGSLTVHVNVDKVSDPLTPDIIVFKGPSLYAGRFPFLTFKREIGKPVSGSIYFANRGDQPLRITVGPSDNPEFSVVTGTRTIAPGKGTAVTVNFTATAAGTVKNGQFLVTSNDPAHPSVSVGFGSYVPNSP